MKAKEYLEEQKFGYDHFTELTSTGINPDNNNIAQFAEDYHQAKLNLLTIPVVVSCTELRDKETPNIEDWLKDNFKRLDRHSFTNTHEDTVWLRSELVEVYNQLHP